MIFEYRIKYTGICTQGSVRNKNEDNLWCSDRCLPLLHNDEEYIFEGCADTRNTGFAVFDGLGGAVGGDAASYMAANEFGRLVSGDAHAIDLQELCFGMNRKVLSYASENGIRETGSTAVGLLCDPDMIRGFNLGDSRCYLFSEGRLSQLSTDHSFCSVMTGKNILTQCLGVPETEFILEPAVFSATYRSDDIFLLCSDGLWKAVDEKDLEEILAQGEALSETLMKIKEKYLENGASDNMTLILLEIQRSPKEADCNE